MRWLRLIGSLKLLVSFAKEPYKRDYNLQKRAGARRPPKLPHAIRVGPNEGDGNFGVLISGVYPIFGSNFGGFSEC